MKRILTTIIFSLMAFNGFSQSLDSIKHIELISEIQDSMALINKSDINKINQTFHELECANALNEINDSIINTLVIQTHYLDSILQNQQVIIENEKLINDQLVLDHSAEINHYEKELRQSKNKKIMWQSTTGLSLLTIILILLL